MVDTSFGAYVILCIVLGLREDLSRLMQVAGVIGARVITRLG
jgi:hypothetical protein